MKHTICIIVIRTN